MYVKHTATDQLYSENCIATFKKVINISMQQHG